MVIDELLQLGISAQPRQGEQRTLCPQCSSSRREKANSMFIGEGRK
jgi:hypothetical protein